MNTEPESIRGRGAADNPPNRFESIHYEPDPDAEIDPTVPRTQLLRDTTRSIITHNDSPDVVFSASVNPYRGCEHGCSYCYARPYHEYLGFSAGLDFETKILVKEDAPELLRRELKVSKWKPQPLALSGVTDAYQPIERRLEITRRCLQVLAEFRNPVMIVTKNALVTRDIDVLGELAKLDGASVFISITTLDNDLAGVLEPRASRPTGRLAAVSALHKAGIPVGVLVAPVIPGLNDHEIPAIVEAATEAGAVFAGYTALRLPHGVGPLFENWLTRHFPERKERVLGRVREMRGGKLNDPKFGSRMRGEGIFAKLIKDVFQLACKRTGIGGFRPNLTAEHFRRPGEQRMLFD